MLLYIIRKHASGAGDIGFHFKSKADQISLILQMTRHRYNFDVWRPGATPRRDGYHSHETPERVLSEYNEDLIFDCF